MKFSTLALKKNKERNKTPRILLLLILKHSTDLDKNLF